MIKQAEPHAGGTGAAVIWPRLRRAMSCAAALSVAACSVGPHLGAAGMSAPAHYEASAGSSAIDWTPEMQSSWWTLFHSAELDRLLAESFQHNPSLAAAEDAISAAQANADATAGALYPSIGLNLGLQRSTALRSIIGGQVRVPGQPFTLAQATAGVSFSPDIFGLNQDKLLAAQSRVAVATAERNAGAVMLAGNVAEAAVALGGFQAEFDLQQSIVQEEKQVLGVLQANYRIGSATLETVEQQQATLSASQAELPLLATARDNEQHQLDLLLGRFPDAPVATVSFNTLTFPARIPVTLPSEMLKTRPDIAAATAKMDAASHLVDASTAAMYPSLNLSASFGGGSDVALFNPVTSIYSLVSGLAVPVFEGGTLSARKREAVAEWKQDVHQYEGTVLKAFNEVADALRKLDGDEVALREREAAETAANQAFQLARSQYDAGAIDYPTLLLAQTSFQQTAMQALMTKIELYQNVIALFVALGGKPPLPVSATTGFGLTVKAAAP